VDANGNFRPIGTATTDYTGAYNLVWQPDIAGKYTIIASFTGTNAYYGSSAQTAFVADDLPTTTPAATHTPDTVTEQYFLPAVAAIIVAIAIVGIVLAILLIRKHP
jgi:hypothetical protein